jgi:spermidine/putrescine transport system permease protein
VGPGAKSRARVLACCYWLALAAFTLPLALLALTSFSNAVVVGFPLGRFTVRWYSAALADPAFRRAFVLSVVVALASAALAVLAGTWIALAAAALRVRWLRGAFLAAAVVPLATPGIIHAVALRIAIQTIGLPPGPLAIVLGHAIHATPYAVVVVGARLAALPAEQVAAARVFGARPFGLFVRVVVPWLRPALFGAGALAALTSFDDFIRSFFLGGYEPTLPVLVFGRLRSGLTPEIDAVAVLVLLAACVLGLAASVTRR